MRKHIVTFTTIGARRLIGQAHNYQLETYYSPAEEIEVFCSTDERENCEREHEIVFTSDIVEDERDFRILLTYLRADCSTTVEVHNG